MVRILLLYFSGTGNTLYITNLFKKELEKNNEVIIKSIEENIDFDCDLLGIGYPIYAFNAPKIIEKQLKKLSCYNKPYFIYKTSGEPLKLNNSSSWNIKKIMKRKSNIFKGEYHLIMPYNIIFKYSQEFVDFIMYYNEKYIAYIVKNINNSIFEKIKSNIFVFILSRIFLIQRLGARVNSKLYKVDMKKCLCCEKCLKNCPVNNIILKDNKICFINKCQMCMRCSFNCPTNAIKIGFLNRWKVNGPYRLSVNNNGFINKNSKGFYRLFKKYYRKLDQILNDK